MLRGSALGSILAFAVLWNDQIYCVSNRKEECLVNHYQDGENCTECPIGYFGYNCSGKCYWPNYGPLCSKVCECQPCHHEDGCNSTEETTEHEMEAKLLLDRNKLTMSTYSINLMIITTGSFIVLV